jgi:hypothetical protein
LVEIQLSFATVDHTADATEVIDIDIKFNLNALNNIGGKIFT